MRCLRASKLPSPPNHTMGAFVPGGMKETG
jgi:hypothetical protein